MFFLIGDDYNTKKTDPLDPFCFYSAKGTRTLVTGVRGQCPGPLDDGTKFAVFSELLKRRQI